MAADPRPDSALLAGARRTVAERLADIENQLTELRGIRVSQSDDDEHDPDGSPLSAAWSRLEGLRLAALAELTDLDDADTRWAAGSYGVCAGCGGPVAVGRLERAADGQILHRLRPVTGRRPTVRKGSDMIWIGGFTADLAGRGTGISAVADPAAQDEPIVAVPVESPSWLAAHPTGVVFAALEGRGVVAAFRPDGLRLTPIGEVVPVGRTVCHLQVDPAGRFLIASCYGDGAVVRIDLADDGTPAGAVTGSPSTDPYGGHRQSRAHAAIPLPNNRWATTDLGHDQLRLWNVDDGLAEVGTVVLPEGSGPRHVAVHPDGRLFVVTEYSCEVLTLQPAGDGYALTGRVALLTDRAGTDTAAGLRLQGDRLYSAVRGQDVLVTLDVAGPATVLDRRPSGGAVPRDHVLIDGELAVAHQGSDEVTIWMLDRNGVPEAIRRRIPVGTPTAVLPVRARAAG